MKSKKLKSDGFSKKEKPEIKKSKSSANAHAGWEKKTSASKYVDLREAEEGEILIDSGVYLGRSKRVDAYGKHGFEFREKNGGVKTMNPSGQLEYQMEDVEEGTVCRVVYMGQEKMPSGKYKNKPVHQFELYTKPGETTKKKPVTQDDEDLEDQVDEDEDELEDEDSEEGSDDSEDEEDEDNESEDEEESEEDEEDEEEIDIEELEDMPYGKKAKSKKKAKR